jgi:hypothetical protein
MVGESVGPSDEASVGEFVGRGAFEGGFVGGMVGTPVGVAWGTIFGALDRRLEYLGALGALGTLGGLGTLGALGGPTSLVGVIDGDAIRSSVGGCWMGESGRGPLLGLRLFFLEMRLLSLPCLSKMSPPRFFLALFVFLNSLSVSTLCAKQVIRGKIISHSRPVNDAACATKL